MKLAVVSRYKYRTKKGINFPCSTCSNPVYVYPSDLERVNKKGICCSPKCFYVHKVGKKLVRDERKRIETRKSNGWWKSEESRLNYINKVTPLLLKYRKKKGDKISEIGRRNISIAKSRDLLNGKIKSIGKGKFGYFWSDKNNKKFCYRSSWELMAMKIFEQMSDILFYDHEVLSIPYKDLNGKLHRTIPDFLIYRSNGLREVIEIKPQYKIEKDIDNTVLKLDATWKYSNENGMKFSVWTEKELNIKK